MTQTQSINQMIREAGWFDGTENQWADLTKDERQARSFAATGCEVAYPTWTPPVDCLHTGCCVRRGELPKIALTNRMLQAEIDSGWLRFHKTPPKGERCFAGYASPCGPRPGERVSTTSGSSTGG